MRIVNVERTEDGRLRILTDSFPEPVELPYRSVARLRTDLLGIKRIRDEMADAPVVDSIPPEVNALVGINIEE